MKIKTLLIILIIAILGIDAAYSQVTLQLVQVTSESQVVSGRPYKLYYVSNSTGCFVKAESDRFLVTDGYQSDGDEVIYYLISDGNGKWKIQSKATNMYFPVPTRSITFVPTNEEAAGLWTLNFLTNGNLAPYSYNATDNKEYSLNRYTGILHGWDKGEADVNQFKLYEWVATPNAEGKVYTLSGTNWMLIPAAGIYYYLYDRVNKVFAYPSESGDWMTSTNNAVPLRVVKQGDTYYRLSTKDGTKTFMANSVTDFEMTEAEGTVPEDVYANLIGGQTKVTDLSTELTDGWYALRIREDSEHPQYDGNFLYTLDTPYGMGTIEYPYPVGHGGTYDKHPAKNDVTYYFHMWPVQRGDVTYYHWQLPNGIYIVNYLNNYPIRYHLPLSDFVLGQNGDGTFYIQSSDFRTKAFDGYMGKTAHKHMASSTKLDIYKIDLAAAGLTPWKVVFNEGADNIPLAYTGSADIQGPRIAYNNGYFFLPTSVTPTAADFDTSAPEFAGQATIDPVNNTISVTYAPDICFTADDVTVVQGSRTTGVGNTKQVLLRMKIVPEAPCRLSSLAFTLAGAEQFSKVEAYLTTADQLHAEGVSSTKLGEKTSGLTGDEMDHLSIATDGCPVLKMNESYYVWLTADIVDLATAESEIVDAAFVSVSYTNAKDAEKTVDITSKGDPEGNMRIFKHQSFVRVSTDNNGSEAHYYRNPAILNIAGNTVLAFFEDRYDNANGLGKDYDGSDYGHRIDVKVVKSTDNGITWSAPYTVANGSEEGTPSGYAGPAVAYNGTKIVCLMAAGSNAYDSSAGLTQMAMSTSTDGGNSWTGPVPVTINWDGLNPTSFYVTPGKGVAYSDGHVAFVVNAKVGGRLREYLLYSDADCTTWTVDATPLAGKGKESKLQLMNDGSSLLVMTKTPASKECNNDLLYFKRSGEDESLFDAILQTIMWKYEDERLKDLRLYVSFDEATSWKELFYIQPGNAATSSMQKVYGNHLAICFEDGSIGNDENGNCYALTYVVIDNAMIQKQSIDINKAIIINTGVTDGKAPYVNGTGWTKSVITNNNSGFAGITISTDHTAFNRETANGQRVFDLRPSAAGGTDGVTDQITITAPPGYVIKSYTITGYNKSNGETYTLTAGTKTADFNGGSTNQGTLTVDNIFAPSTTFSFSNSNSTKSSYALITNFEITLTREEFGVTLHQVNTDGQGDTRSYATLYVPYDLTQADDYTKAYYVLEVAGGKAILTPTSNDGRDIPKNTAVLLVNSQGSTHCTFAITEGLTSVVNEEVNLLKGTLTGKTIDLTNSSNYYTFGRRKKSGASIWVAGFYKTNNAEYTLGANRAYLDVPATLSAAPSLGFDISFDDEETTSLSEELSVESEEFATAAEWYDLSGRRLPQKPTLRGIYINNGKKVVIK